MATDTSPITLDALFATDSLLTAEEREIRDTVAAFADKRLRPHIADWFEAGTFPARELAPELGELGLLGMHLEGYGCAGLSATAYGLACQELEAVDSGVRSMVSVQGSLAMTAIHHFGSEEQKQRWLPEMAAGRALGCFGLTEPDFGSNPAGMRTRARRDGGDWVLDGAKMWITNGSVADVAVVWAYADEGGSRNTADEGGRNDTADEGGSRNTADEGGSRNTADEGGERPRVRGFLVPAGTPGFTAREMHRKLSLRASVTAELTFDGVRLPADAVLPESRGLASPLACLGEARFGIVFGALGAARDCLAAAIEYARTREVFDKPLAAYQLTQAKLADLALEYGKGQLLAIHLGRLKDRGELTSEQVSAGKLNSTREAIAIARECRTILGANGITLDYPVLRHANNLESVLTYEGTAEVHQLVLGKALTGSNAFR